MIETGAAAALRAAFDRSFAEPPVPRGAAPARYVAIRVGAAPYAIPLADVASVHRGRRVTATPSPARALLGLAGLRGVVVPVYDLDTLLHGVDAAARAWFVVIGGPDVVALAFDHLDGQVSVTAQHHIGALTNGALPNGALMGGALTNGAVQTGSAVQTGGAVQAGGGAAPILNVQALLGAIARVVLEGGSR